MSWIYHYKLSYTGIQNITYAKDIESKETGVRSNPKRRKQTNAFASSFVVNITMFPQRKCGEPRCYVSYMLSSHCKKSRAGIEILLPPTLQLSPTGHDFQDSSLSRHNLEILRNNVIKVQLHRRLDVIALDTRNGKATEEVLSCSVLCGILVREYRPFPG